MEIVLENAGKCYNRQWVFRGLSYTFEQGNSYAIIGRNGSGKSTLASILTGRLLPTEGTVIPLVNGKKIDEHAVYAYISLAAPYLELIEEFTVSEMIAFHFRFKKCIHGMAVSEVLEYARLSEAAYKQVSHLSSGMKQRLKLALSFLSNCPILILDEPTGNLDAGGVKWYYERLEAIATGKLLVICSNQPHEYQMCSRQILMEDFGDARS